MPKTTWNGAPRWRRSKWPKSDGRQGESCSGKLIRSIFGSSGGNTRLQYESIPKESALSYIKNYRMLCICRSKDLTFSETDEYFDANGSISSIEVCAVFSPK